MKTRVLKLLPFGIFIILFSYYGAYQSLAYPTGADWAQYMMGAQHIWWPSVDTSYPEWRAPLYLYLLGLLAHVGSYLQAGSWLASTGWLLMGVALYGMGVLLRRPIVGIGLSVALLGVPLSADGFHQLGPYPLLGGLCGLLWLGAFGVLLAPKNKYKWLFLYALCSGLAVAIDSRSVLIAGAAAPMLIRRWSNKELVASVCIFILSWLPHIALLKYLKLSLLPMSTKILEQRRFVLRHLQGGNLHPDHPEIDSLASVCAQHPPMQATTQWLFESCSWAMMTVNIKAWAGAGLIFTLIWGVGLIGSFRQWRYGLALVLLIGVGVGLPMLLVWHPPRYAYPLLVPLLASLPVMICLLLDALPVPRVVVSALSLLPLVLIWPARMPSEQPMTWDFPPTRIPMVNQIRQSVGESDSYIDCARLDTGLLWAPNSRMPSNVRTFLPSQRDCTDFIKRGTGWVLVKASDGEHLELSDYGWDMTVTFTDQNRELQLWGRRP